MPASNPSCHMPKTTKLIGPFVITSDLDLACAETAAQHDMAKPAPRVVITRGKTPEYLPGSRAIGPLVEINERRLLFNLPSGTTVLLEDGQTITYDAPPSACQAELQLYILGSVWGALCYQNGLLPLHCSSVIDHRNPGAVLAFSGVSGAGKSTFAAGLTQKHFSLFADDILTVDTAPVKPLCYPESKKSKLWGDAIDMLSLERSGAVLPNDPDYDKHYVNLTRPQQQPGHLSAIYLLSAHGGPPESGDCKLSSLQGTARLEAIMGCLYRPRFAEAILSKQELFELISRLTRHTEVYHFSRPRYKSRFRDTLDAFIAHRPAYAGP